MVGNEQGMHEVIAGEHPEKNGRGYLGVNIETEFLNDNSISFSFIIIVTEFLTWLFLLSLGLGLANLLPLGPVDGGRMYQLACRKVFGKKKGDIVWTKTSILFLALIIILVFIPILKAIFL